MGSSRSSRPARPVIYDLIRARWIPDSPEERVRQALLHQMLGPLAFPKGLIAVEKKVGALSRRTDVVAYCRGEEGGLRPLVLVECKAEKADEEAYRQASGYNGLLAAPYLCLAHGGGIRTFWKEGEEIRSVPFLPPYAQLLQRFGRW